MTETQRRELEAFLADQKAIGGLKPSSLAHDTIIWVATKTFMFKLTVDNSHDGRTRYVVESGSASVPGNPICINVVSHYPKLKYDMPDYLGLGMRLVLEFSNGSRLMSGEIDDVTISGKTKDGDNYEYSLWDD